MKNDLKTELTEKILMLKELDKVRNSQMIVHENQENLKNIVEYTASEKDKYQERLLNCENQLKVILQENEKIISENEDLMKNKSDLKEKNKSLEDRLNV